MTDNMFDKFVRDKLRDHQSAVPPGLWEKIERKKDKEPKGGFFLPRTAIWAALFIIVAGIGTGYYLSRNNYIAKENKPASHTTDGSAAANKGNHTGENNNTTANNLSDNNNNNKAEHTPDISTSNSPEQNKDAAIQQPGTETAKLPTGTSANKNDDRKTNTVVAGNVKTGNRSVNNNAYATNNNNSSITGKVNKDEKYLNAVVPGKKGKQANTGRQKKDIATLLPIQKDEMIITEDEGIDVKRIALTTGKTAYNLRNIPSFGQGKYNLSELKITGIDCPTAGKLRRDDWYLEVYGSPDIVMKSVKATSNAAFVAKKDSTESQQVSFTAGFRISKAIGENMLLKTGLQYSQINERFDLRTENERKIITVVTIRTITGSNGADSTISDTSSVEQIGYRLQRTYNRYRSIDIPVLLSYEFGTNKLKFGLNAGAIVNLYSWYNGNTIDDSLNVISMNSKVTAAYKQNIGIGLYAGISIIKPVANKFDIFIEPYMKYNLSNMARSSAYTQRFNSVGINFGVRYKLKGRQRSELN